jgi:cysteine desulfurase
MKKIYLDYAAATPIDKDVKKEMTKVSDIFANPSANYSLAKKSDEILFKARKSIGTSLNAKADEIFFTSGTTESNNLAIFGMSRANKKNGNHLITIKTEHPSVLACFERLKEEGFIVSYCPLKPDGTAKTDQLEKLINKKTSLVSISLANSEIGTIQPLAKIIKTIRNSNSKALLHSDGSIAASFMSLNVDRLGVDALSIGGSKIYGPNFGALYVRRGVNIEPIIYGGDQNFGLRSGTQDISYAVGLSKALEITQRNYKVFRAESSKLKEYLLDKVKRIYPEVIINSSQKSSLTSITSLSFDGFDGEDLMYRFDKKGILVGTGAACRASDEKPSQALIAIGRSKSEAQGSLRISFGKESSVGDIDQFCNALGEILKDLS